MRNVFNWFVCLSVSHVLNTVSVLRFEIHNTVLSAADAVPAITTAPNDWFEITDEAFKGKIQ